MESRVHLSRRVWLAAGLVVVICLLIAWLSAGSGRAASTGVALAAPEGAAALRGECDFSFEGSNQRWIPQPDNADGNQLIWATPVPAHPYSGQYSLQIDFEGAKGAVGLDSPPADYCTSAVVRGYVYADSSAASDVWIQFYLLDGSPEWAWRDSGPGTLLLPGQWVLLQWDLSQYAGDIVCPLHRLGLQFGHGGGHDTFYLDCVGFGPVPTETLTPTATTTQTPSSTPTTTPMASATATLTPSATPTPSSTATRTPSATPSPTPSPAPTATRIPSATPSLTATSTPTAKATRTPTRTATATTVPEPEPNHVFLGAFLPDIATSSDLDRNSGKHHGIQMGYFAFAYDGVETVFPEEWARTALRNRSTPMISLEPWDPFHPDQITLAQIVAGQWDGYLTSFAQAARDFHYPIYVRFAHEANGNWYPWSGAPAMYQAAWAHVIVLFSQVGANNVHWVWSINAESVPADNHYSQYYPGDNTVDVIGVDGYNWGDKASWTPPPACKSFTEIFDSALTDLAQRYPGKPLMISEFAAACDNGCDKGTWISDSFQAVKRYPAVMAMIWFSEAKYEGSTWVDWRPWCAPPSDVTSPGICQECLRAYQSGVADPYFRADAPLSLPRSWVFLPLVLRPPKPSATPTPTATATAAPTQTPSPSPSPTPAVIEDFEHDLADWSNPYNDLDMFRLTNDACEGQWALQIGGADQANSWVGAAVLFRWGNRLQDWRGKQALAFCIKRGETRRGGRPSLTVMIEDKNGYSLVLHRESDQYLDWPGGGWRTIIGNDDWFEVTLPLRGESGFDWFHVSSLRIEVRRTYGSGGWEANPDDVYIDTIQLR